MGLLRLLLNLPSFATALPLGVVSIPGQDPHSQFFHCLSPAHDMNVCGFCLTFGPAAQQCRAIGLCLWNLEPWFRCPLTVLTVHAGIMKLVLQFGSIDLARHWLANGIWPIWITQPHVFLRRLVLLHTILLWIFRQLGQINYLK